jgi:hypothetical protein
MLDLNKCLNYFYIERRELFGFFSNFFSFFYIRINLILIIGLILLDWLVAYIMNIRLKGGLTVLHYNVDFGVDLIGEPEKIYILPLLGLVLAVINTVLLGMVYKNDRFTASILLAATIFINIFLFIALAFIYLFNFNLI